MVVFNKPALLFNEQVNKLEERGLIIPDVDKAVEFMAHCNYYRFAEYGKYFSVSKDKYDEGTTFDTITELYCFDAEFSRLMFTFLSKIELSFRCRLAYAMAHALGPLCLSDPANFRNYDFLPELKSQLRRSKEPFILHYRDTYGLEIPPVWAAFEIVSFGLLSKIFKSVRSMEVIKVVAVEYGLHKRKAQNVFHHLSYVRNICAHHSKLWDRPMDLKLANMTWPILISQDDACCICPTVRMLLHLNTIIPASETWKQDLKDLLVAHRPFVARMGFDVAEFETELWLL